VVDRPVHGWGALVKGPDFKRWRKLLGWSQKHAAEQLGLKRRVVQYYEKGERGDKTVKIPRTVRLACYALTLGVEDYQGPPKKDREDEVEVKDKVRRKTKDKTAEKDAAE
jgi:transcriptional regulator with XRE-family HTH domain